MEEKHLVLFDGVSVDLNLLKLDFCLDLLGGAESLDDPGLHLSIFEHLSDS